MGGQESIADGGNCECKAVEVQTGSVLMVCKASTPPFMFGCGLEVVLHVILASEAGLDHEATSVKW